MKFIPFDANYFNAGNTNGDCVIRALCVATLFGYKTLMRLFGKEDEFIMGSGYDGGITPEEIDDFADKTGIITKVWGGKEYEDVLDKVGITEDEDLEHFLKNDIDDIIAANNIRKRRFMVVVRDFNKKGDTPDIRRYHAVALVHHNGEWTAVDITDRDNNGKMPISQTIPVELWAVNKMPNKESPLHYNNEKKAVLAQRSREVSDYFKKSRARNGK